MHIDRNRSQADWRVILSALPITRQLAPADRMRCTRFWVSATESCFVAERWAGGRGSLLVAVPFAAQPGRFRNRSQADWRVIPSALPITCQLAPASRARRTYSSRCLRVSCAGRARRRPLRSSELLSRVGIGRCPLHPKTSGMCQGVPTTQPILPAVL